MRPESATVDRMDHHSPGNTLSAIRAWGDSGEDPARVLTDVACLIGNRLRCDACSIYQMQQDGETLVLAGTVGLCQDCVGSLRMKLTEGLTGLVAEEKQAVVIASHASAHPRFRYFSEAGEEPYESFLGVPIVCDNVVTGVLVVQTVAPHRFTAAEISMMTAASRDLASLLDSFKQRIDEDGAR